MKTGLRIFKSKYTYLYFLLITINLSAQVHINGFCRYRNFNIEPGFNSFLPLSFNNDPQTDFFLFNTRLKSTLAIAGDVNGDLSAKKKVNFRYNITSIKNLSFGNYYSTSYVFVSRKERLAGLLNFRSDGQPNLMHEFRFDSYPEKIDVADIQSDQAPDVLVSGSSFDGLSVLKIRQGKIYESKIVKGIPFTNAIFMDFNNDGIEDIAAVNLFTTEIDLYANNSRGKFSYTRSFTLNELTHSFLSSDIDLDNFEDIIWDNSKNIYIRYGDPVSGYNEMAKIETTYYPHILITGDYNSDGLMDLVYADTSKGIVAAVFALEGRKFSEEVILLKKRDIAALVPYYSKFVNGIAALGASGNIYIVNRTISFAEDFSITAGASPGAVKQFDNRKDGITDISYIDEDIPSLNFLIRNSDGIPNIFKKVNLHYPHKQITVDEYSTEKKVFYCWSEGEKLIEVITADFNKHEYSRNSLYTTGRIEDLKIQSLKGLPATIYACYIKDGIAGANVFEFHDFRYRRVDYSGFALNVQNIGIHIIGNAAGFFTWQKRNSVELYSNDLKKPESQKLIGKLPEGDILFTISTDLFDIEKPSQLAYTTKGSIIKAGEKLNILHVPDSLEITSKDYFWTGAVKPAALKQLFLYDHQNKSLNRITLFNKRKNLILSELISGINVKRYFISSMTQQDYHIVYSDPEENCITIKRIK